MTGEDLRSILHEHQSRDFEPIDLAYVLNSVKSRRRRRISLGAAAAAIAIGGVGASLVAAGAFDQSDRAAPSVQDPVSTSPVPNQSASPSESTSTVSASPTNGTPSATHATSPPVDISAAPGVTPAEAKAAEAFISFALDPGPESAAAVPFSESGVLTGTVDGDPISIPVDTIADSNSWWIDDGVGMTSALFVIENYARTHKDGPIGFEVTDKRPPVCVGPPAEGIDSYARVVSIVSTQRTARDDCTPGFRVDLQFERNFIIAALLDVQEP